MGDAVRAATAIPWSRLHDCITVPHTHACADIQMDKAASGKVSLPEKYRNRPAAATP